MNPLSLSSTEDLIHKDAVFVSPHKFVGGPGTPGLLIAKKNLFRNPVPSQSGGGTVFYVTHHTQRYLKEIEMREEGGTPAIVESIRAGLVFQLKQALSHKNIMEREEELVMRAQAFWRTVPNLIILGDGPAKRLPIFSFVILHKDSGRLLHHNFVCTVLNDVFGIQARGGCACAGPYAEDLLGMDENVALKLEDLILEDQRLDRHHLRRYREYSERELLRPGFARLNLPFFMSNEGIEFILKAVSMVAEHGWKLLPDYNMNPSTGEWRHWKNMAFKDRKWLSGINYRKGQVDYPLSPKRKECTPSYQTRLNNAERIFEAAQSKKVNRKLGDQSLFLGEDGEEYRWFLLPSEASLYLAGKEPTTKQFQMPFFPRASVKESKMKSKRPSRSAYNPHVCATCGGARSLTNDLQDANIAKDVAADGRFSFEKKKEESQTGTLGDSGICSDEAIAANLSDDLKNDTRVKTVPAGDIADGCESRDFEKSIKKTSSPTSNSSDSPKLHFKLDHSIVNAVGDTNEEAPIKYKVTPDEASTQKPICSQSGRDGLVETTGVEKKLNGKHIRFQHPPKSIFTPVIQAIEEFSMINDGDRVLLCLSGGKDSLSMLHAIRQYQFYARPKGISFEFGAMTVDPKSSSYDPSPLKEYLANLQVPYFYEEQDIISQAANLAVCESICAFCSRMKRGRMYACARREGYNVLAIGQHLDDIAESFLMSAFHNGLLRTMKASYTVADGDLKVIRPLLYVRERDLRQFAEQAKLPVIPENCPACFEAPKERHRTKQLLAQQEILFPNLFSSIQTALKPLFSKSRTGLESNKNNSDNFDDFLV
ncbi:uncharacterized protein LOC135686606 [Rhopilema esculentum]|uniref:uncharacterized protein LOC135686606 n=1 Tax=Rhopilema esculentum TaxID=499914 RepID=UPI0031D60245